MKTTNEVQENVWVADLIGDDYLSWPDDAKVEIIAGTGRGKTYWAINTFIVGCFKSCKKVLFACNRHELYTKNKERVDDLPGVTATTYQALQSKIMKGTVEKYDVIVADEISYVQDDALFNFEIDIFWNWLTEQADSQIIFMDANGGSFFDMVQDTFGIPDEQIYKLPKSYSYVDAVYFYDANQEKHELEQIVDNVLSRPNGEKALVFVKSMKRLRELRGIYGDKADYFAGTRQNESWLNKSCISNEQFSKRILFTTTALNCGIDIKDEKLRTICCELFDLHNLIQCIGRKRPIDENDTCSFYFCNFKKQTAYTETTRLGTWIRDAELFLASPADFYESFLYPRYYVDKKTGERKQEEPRNYRQAMKENPIFCADPRNPEQTIVNMCCLEKCKVDYKNIHTWHKWEGDFSDYLLAQLGDELKSKARDLIIEDLTLDTFNSYLEKNYQEQTRYFREEENLAELREMFNQLGLQDRWMGIHTLNGKLQDMQSIYRLVSEPQNSRKEPHFRKKYWHIVKVDEIQEG